MFIESAHTESSPYVGVTEKGVVGSEVDKQSEGIGGMLKQIHLNSFSLRKGLLNPHCGATVN